MVQKNNKNNKSNQKILLAKLSEYLASNYALYLKTQNFHWNVTGPEFFALHGFFEKQYTALAEAVDLIAEHIKTFGVVTPGSFSEFATLSKIQDSIGKKSDKKMIIELLADHSIMADLTKELIIIAKQDQDDASQDLLINRLTFHDKTIWMLRSCN